MVLAINKAFDLVADDIVELSTENDTLKNENDAYDGKLLQESKDKLIKKIDYDKRANSIMSRMKKQIKNH